MAKDLIGNQIADTSVSIPKKEYEALLRESETLRIITEFVKGESIVTVSTIKVLLGLNNLTNAITPNGFNPKPPKEGI